MLGVDGTWVNPCVCMREVMGSTPCLVLGEVYSSDVMWHHSGGDTCHVSKWVLLADMADDVAATSAMTWQVGPTLPSGGGYPMRGCHVAVLTYICAGVRGTRFVIRANDWCRGNDWLAVAVTRYGANQEVTHVQNASEPMIRSLNPRGVDSEGGMP
ncbi:hypothetical protein Tco_0127535 [Tanacetum coccineum]